MTVVGKILVFFNLVFSLVVGAFAVMDYTARTHWADGYAKLDKQFQASQASANAYEAEANKLAKEKKTLNAKLVDAGKNELEFKGPEDADRAALQAIKLLEERRKQIDDLKTLLETQKKQTVAAKKEASETKTALTRLKADNELRQSDTEKMRVLLKKQIEDNVTLVKDKNDLRDAAVSANITVKSLTDKNNQMQDRLTELEDQLRTARASAGTARAGGAARRGPAPPPENVEGLIKKADGSLVTISLGSDAGLAKGQTMEVFRLSPTPKYIGKIRLIEVTPKLAVGQASGKMSTRMQIGDRVASRITAP